jgi:gentisate 1,2-dioxygenase
MERYYARIAEDHMVPLWERIKTLLPPEPQVASRPHLWDYDALRPKLLEAADLIAEHEAERRVLVLENPGREGLSAVTDTLFAGLQLIMPGEVAPAHRHTPAALRFILECDSAFTAVEGERLYMAPGDFILNPSWAWHDHVNEGDAPVIWLDVLDIPTVRFLGPRFTEHYPHGRYPEQRPPGDSAYRYGRNMKPVGAAAPRLALPMQYPYVQAREALERLQRHHEIDACHGYKMEYIDPMTGDSPLPTISACLQLLPAGFRGDPYRTTEGSVLCVAEGKGRVILGIPDNRLEFNYKPKDIIAIPCWYPYHIAADEESVLFSASDRSMQTKLGLWREHRGA